MKILIVIEPGFAGVFRHVEGLAGYLLDQGQEVHLAYSNRRGTKNLEMLVERVKESGGEVLNLNVGNAPEPGDLSALLRLRAMAHGIGPDVIHSHSSKAGVLGRMLAVMGIRARFLYTPHAYYGLGKRGGAKVLLYDGIEALFGRIGTTIAVSIGEAAFATARLGIRKERIRVIGNPVDPTVFRPATAEDRKRQRAELGIAENAVVLGGLGRLTYQKDPQTLYRAIAPVMRVRKELILCHVGEGELDEELKALALELGIQGQLVRRPYLDEPRGFYQALDGFALTSRYEGLPISALEAMATELPLILSDIPGVADIRSAGLSHCWTAGAENVAEFTSAIDAWLADLPLRRAINHRDIAVAQFSPATAFGAVLSAYREG